jgi:hypothetical protein
MHEYYDQGRELGRLAESYGQLEFVRTKEIILRHLPPPPAVVADIGGGPGRYALWLAQLGYEVLHRDLMPLHVRGIVTAVNPSPACRAITSSRDRPHRGHPRGESVNVPHGRAAGSGCGWFRRDLQARRMTLVARYGQRPPAAPDDPAPGHGPGTDVFAGFGQNRVVADPVIALGF